MPCAMQTHIPMLVFSGDSVVTSNYRLGLIRKRKISQSG